MIVLEHKQQYRIARTTPVLAILYGLAISPRTGLTRWAEYCNRQIIWLARFRSQNSYTCRRQFQLQSVLSTTGNSDQRWNKIDLNNVYYINWYFGDEQYYRKQKLWKEVTAYSKRQNIVLSISVAYRYGHANAPGRIYRWRWRKILWVWQKKD